MQHIKIPITDEILMNLKAGEKVLLSGWIYTARDIAHKRLVELIKTNQDLPFLLDGQVIYYSGPILNKKGSSIVDSFGPTTSKRMDEFTPTLLKNGLKVMIGKGERSPFITRAIKKHKALYLAAVGGCGAFYGKCVEKFELVAFEYLHSEAIRKFKVDKMPLFVAIDSRGESIYK